MKSFFKDFTKKLDSFGYSRLYAEINSFEHFQRFSLIYQCSALPILAGGIGALMFPYFSYQTAILPDLSLYSMLYAGYHSTFIASTHLGFGAVLHNETLIDNKPINNFQLVYPFVAPFIAGPMIFMYWSSPFNVSNSIGSLLGISFIYLGTLGFDYFYVHYKKTLPIWYLNIKVRMTLMAVTGLVLLAAGIYSFPLNHALPSKNFPPTLEEIKALN